MIYRLRIFETFIATLYDAVNMARFPAAEVCSLFFAKNVSGKGHSWCFKSGNFDRTVVSFTPLTKRKQNICSPFSKSLDQTYIS